MSPRTTQLRLLPSSTHFREHPDSVAGRLRTESIDRTYAELRALADTSSADDDMDWLEVGLYRDPEEVEDDRIGVEGDQRRKTQGDPVERSVISECPLGTSWLPWDMVGVHRYDQQLTPEEWEACADARRVAIEAHRGLVRPDWEVGSGNRRGAPIAPESGVAVWRWGNRYPLIHAEVVVDGIRVHIDRVAVTNFSPGRSFLEFRIQVNGQLVGRGGRSGGSLGGGGSDLPAVGRIAPHLAITVDDVSDPGEPTVELWEVSGAP